MDWMQAPTKIAQEAGRNVGGIKAAKTISLPISYWALLEQIRSKTRIGLQSTIKEVNDEYEIIPRKKCKKCKCYLAKGVVSLLCLKCSIKQNGIS